MKDFSLNGAVVAAVENDATLFFGLVQKGATIDEATVLGAGLKWLTDYNTGTGKIVIRKSTKGGIPTFQAENPNACEAVELNKELQKWIAEQVKAGYIKVKSASSSTSKSGSTGSSTTGSTGSTSKSGTTGSTGSTGKSGSSTSSTTGGSTTGSTGTSSAATGTTTGPDADDEKKFFQAGAAAGGKLFDAFYAVFK